MQNVWVLRGLPASGKSSLARMIAEDTGAVRFNMDDLRKSMGFPAGSPNWTKERENLAFELMVQGVVQAVRGGFDVVIDNTHVTNSWVQKYRTALQYENVRFRVPELIPVPIETYIERDANRTGSEHVGEDVIRRMARSLAKNPYRTAGELEEFLNSKPFEIKKYKGTPGKPQAALVDLDGTMALMKPGGRSPYQDWRADEDDVNKPVLMAVRAARAYGLKVIACSGRDEGRSKEATQRWFAKNGIILDGLVMRGPGDRRKDSQVKHDLFWSDLSPNYDIQWVWDDRRQVISLWRAMGLSAWQVAEGDF